MDPPPHIFTLTTLTLPDLLFLTYSQLQRIRHLKIYLLPNDNPFLLPISHLFSQPLIAANRLTSITIDVSNAPSMSQGILFDICYNNLAASVEQMMRSNIEGLQVAMLVCRDRDGEACRGLDQLDGLEYIRELRCLGMDGQPTVDFLWRFRRQALFPYMGWGIMRRLGIGGDGD